MVERGVKVEEIEKESLNDLLRIFRENKWMSLFEPVSAYTCLFCEFYSNINTVHLNYPPSFETKVLGTPFLVNAALISKIT
jgi:hypothetical protein